MLGRIHLVRHGEVDNPDQVVYADLPGFRLSDTGRAQAEQAASRLAESGAAVVIASPLQRAVETAQVIAGVLGAEVTTDHRLGEWRLARRWAGVRWGDLPWRFPGELEAYLVDPTALPFSPESLAAVSERMAAAMHDLGRARPGGVVVAVSHQDPIQALRLALTGRPLSELRRDPPAHASVTTLDHDGARWVESAVWTPAARRP